MLKIARTIAALQKLLDSSPIGRVALVPTMGNLHAGHMALIRHAAEVAERVIVSIFVNPLQFGPREDYSRYPRTLERDLELLSAEPAIVLFAPSANEIYPNERDYRSALVTVPGLSEILCGASRPGHFQGAATVVTILLNIVRPQVAVFGEKDLQQLLVIKRLVADLHMPVEILSHPTVREEDGLALSSRNGYLTAEERLSAPALYRTLKSLGLALQSGRRDYDKLERDAGAELQQAGLVPEYCAIRALRPELDLAPPLPEDKRFAILAAAQLGCTRLIDNLQISLPC